MQKNLNQIINTLNPAQRQAVEQVYGPVLVLAGPGTGKTHMLTTRVAHILASDVGASPQNILCLTFTESAAVEMRNRLQQWIGEAAYQVKIMTFHGFCQWVMDDNSHVFYPLIGEREIADDLQKALVYRHIIKSKKWKYFSSVWDDFVHQYDFTRAVSDLKREGLNPESLRALIPAEKERLEANPDNFYKRKFKEFSPGDWKPQAKVKIQDKIAKMYELAELWETYTAEMTKRRLYDFDDLINWVVAEIKSNQNLRLDLQERFQWLLVDEYQDTNASQNAILWQLTEGVQAPNIFAVGDDDQSIYRFQGASVANITDFRTQFADRLEITLSENYRSHQHILDAAYNSVAHNLDRANADKKLDANKTEFTSAQPGTITQAELSGRMAEIGFLADTIKSHLEAGVPAKEIAILVRKNREIAELARELPKFGINVSAQVAQNIFENEAVRKLILMLEIFSDAKHDEKLFDLLHSDFLAIDAKALLQLSLQKTRDESLSQTLLNHPSSDERLNQFFDFFITTRRDYHHARAAVIAEKFLYESGLAQHMTAEKHLEDWQAIRKFIAWMREQAKGETFRSQFGFNQELKEILNRINLHQELNIPVFPDKIPADAHSVRLMTAHKSKGLEFEVVFIPGLEDKAWGNPRGKAGMALPQLQEQNFDENQEERRLFFVGLTRAKSQLYLSYSTTDFGGREKAPSIFWHEIPENLSTKTERDALEEKLQSLLPVFYNQAEKTLTEGEKELLQERVKNFRWSASSLQTYLDCPRKFLYQNLYRFPRRPLPQMALGTSLHQALERTFYALAQGQTPSLSYLLSEYESALRGHNIGEEDLNKWLEYGKEILENYHQIKLQNFTQDYPFGFELEYDFGHFNPQIEGISITGKMDKIVYLDAKKSKTKITDYKSGKPKSIKPGENYWRQLVFYDLLARNSVGVNWQVEQCEIEFLTPDANGKLGTRSLAVGNEDRAKVIQELKEVNTAVMNLEFPLKDVSGLKDDQRKEIEYWQNFGS